MSKKSELDTHATGRRRALKLGAATVTAGALAGEFASDPAVAKDPPPGPAIRPFVDELPVPEDGTNGAMRLLDPVPLRSLKPAPSETRGVGEAARSPHQAWTLHPPRRYYTMEVREGRHKFHHDLPEQQIRGFDGTFPGPTIVARYGVPVLMRLQNKLSAYTPGFGSPEISVHLHNLHLPSESDGFPGDYWSERTGGAFYEAAGAGGFRDHHWVNAFAGGDRREALGTLWYHDHRMDYTASNVYGGMAGFYLLFDRLDSGNEQYDPNNPNALRLPSGVGRYDIPMMLTDPFLDSGGYLHFDQMDTEGFLGNKYCVNGKIQPTFRVERRKYRFRILCASVARFFELYLTDEAGSNRLFDYIANDGCLLPRPLRDSRRIPLAPAERADIVVDFSKYEKGTHLYLVNRLIQRRGRGPEDATVNTRNGAGDLRFSGTRILRFEVRDDPSEPDVSQVPDVLRRLPPIDRDEVVRTRKFEFDRENEVWTVNNRIFDVEDTRIRVKRGTAEIWVLKGKGSWHHPIHVHLEAMRILSRNGVAPPAHERGRKDTIVLHPGEEVRVFIRFRDWTGRYVVHCHNLIHEDHAMMFRFDVED